MKFFNNVREFLNNPIKNKNIRYGLPFFLFVGVALYVIRDCATVRYEFRKVKTLDREEIKALGIKVSERPETLEEAYEKYQEMDIDNWENKRGPRLWDETPQD